MRVLVSSVGVLLVACSGPMPSAMVVFDAGSTLSPMPVDSGLMVDAGVMPIDAGQVQPMDAGVSQSLVTARPYVLRVPSGAAMGASLPLVILLHGYGASGAIQNTYFGLSAEADRSNFLLALPDGTTDASGRRFWNASDACCNFLSVPVDDVAYLNAIIDDVQAKQRVDPKRIFIVGHSNGGFMAHRMACDASNRIAAIVSFAGVGAKDATRCQPSSPVSVAQLHGTADETVAFTGGDFQGAAFPSAAETQRDWATRNGCGATMTESGRLDLVTNLAGDETKVERYSGCQRGDVELWTIENGTHIPSFSTAAFSGAVWRFLSTHPKP
ncbi:MAG: alpha/beta fold hydrolase [Myxococcaceae bacterium]